MILVIVIVNASRRLGRGGAAFHFQRRWGLPFDFGLIHYYLDQCKIVVYLTPHRIVLSFSQ